VNTAEKLIIKQERKDSNTCKKLEESKVPSLCKYNSALTKKAAFKMIQESESDNESEEETTINNSSNFRKNTAFFG
jgi:hypothetical protein